MHGVKHSLEHSFIVR